MLLSPGQKHFYKKIINKLKKFSYEKQPFVNILISTVCGGRPPAHLKVHHITYHSNRKLYVRCNLLGIFLKKPKHYGSRRDNYILFREGQ